MKFVPEELHVTKGDTVVFVNKDIVAHDATKNLQRIGLQDLCRLVSNGVWLLQRV